MKQDKKGISFFELLLLTFIILKLCGIINWNWWWVFSPIWIPVGIYCVIIIIATIGNNKK